jgi:hypothetical protein
VCVRVLRFPINHCVKPGTDERHIRSGRNQLRRDAQGAEWLCKRREERSPVPDECVLRALRYHHSTHLTRPTESWGFKPENIVVLTDDTRDPKRLPTKANILGAMKWLVKDAKAHDSLFFHCQRVIYTPHHHLLMHSI